MICVSRVEFCAMFLIFLSSTGSSVDKKSFTTLDELKQQHMDRHHPSSVSSRLFLFFSKSPVSIYTALCLQVLIKGNARFGLFGCVVVENTAVESQNCITVDLKWNNVEAILETPPLSSSATLVGSEILSPIIINFPFKCLLKGQLLSLAHTCRISK